METMQNFVRNSFHTREGKYFHLIVGEIFQRLSASPVTVGKTAFATFAGRYAIQTVGETVWEIVTREYAISAICEAVEETYGNSGLSYEAIYKQSFQNYDLGDFSAKVMALQGI